MFRGIACQCRLFLAIGGGRWVGEAEAAPGPGSQPRQDLGNIFLTGVAEKLHIQRCWCYNQLYLVPNVGLPNHFRGTAGSSRLYRYCGSLSR
jgi:hypothetical protein